MVIGLFEGIIWSLRVGGVSFVWIFNLGKVCRILYLGKYFYLYIS